jgi:hypothetical protein
MEIQAKRRRATIDVGRDVARNRARKIVSPQVLLQRV